MENSEIYNPNDFDEVESQIADDNANRIFDVITNPTSIPQVRRAADNIFRVASAEGDSVRVLDVLERTEIANTNQFDFIYNRAREGQLQFVNGQPVPEATIKQAYSDMFETQRYLNDMINGMKMDIAIARGDQNAAQGFAKLVSSDRYNQFLIQQRAFEEDERKE